MNLKRQVIKGIRWSVFGSIVTTIIQFAQNLILAWILTPEDFGLMAMVFVFIGFIFPIFDLGLSAAIIQKKNITPLQLSTLYWINILVGIFCFVLIWFIAPFANLFFSTEISLETFIRVISLVFLITPWGTQFGAILVKSLKFDIQNMISIINISSTFIIAIGLAMNDFGVYSLIYSYLFSRVIETVLNFYFGRKYHIPRFEFNLKEVKDLLDFGFFQTGTSMVNYLSANIDKIFIGNILGPSALGLYTIVWNLVLLPLRKINPIVNNIAFPVFSKMDEKKEQINSYYSNAVILLMLINFPILLFLMLNGFQFLELLYGEKWLAASTTLSILAVVGLLKTIANPGGSLLLSKGRADIGFYWNCLWTLALFCSISVTLSFHTSTESVAVGQLLAGVIFGPIWHWLIIKYGNVNYREIGITILKLLSFCVPAFCVVFFIDKININSTLTSFSLKVVSGSILYVFFVFLFFKKRISIIEKIIK